MVERILGIREDVLISQAIPARVLAGSRCRVCIFEQERIESVKRYEKLRTLFDESSAIGITRGRFGILFDRSLSGTSAHLLQYFGPGVNL